ncbi:hypothetical protein GCM10007858_24470 [Bradyrhizobium liaoningense]|nr:hypothetical protein GCM10007858_24470 [Bradyrhizobium liaoningense]
MVIFKDQAHARALGVRKKYLETGLQPAMRRFEWRRHEVGASAWNHNDHGHADLFAEVNDIEKLLNRVLAHLCCNTAQILIGARQIQ